MGFRFRRSINLGGGFRINLSKNGIGYSWGTKFFRVTKTARGTTRRTYSIPGTGISYTEESGSNNNNPNRQGRNPENGPLHQQSENNYRQPTTHTSYDKVRATESTDESQGQSAEVINIVTSIERAIALNSWGTILICSAVLVLFNKFFIVLPVLGIIMKILAHTVATVDLQYSFDAEKEEEHTRRIDAWTILAEGEKEWQVISEQSAANINAQSGANRNIKKIPCSINKGCPFYIKTNVDSVEIKLKNEMLVILPDKVFVVRGKNIGLVDYKDFNITVSSYNFPETEKMPGDAHVVGSTWQFVNANGTPDRKHENNPQIPVCLYGMVHLYSTVGTKIDTMLMVSNIQKSQDFRDLIV